MNAVGRPRGHPIGGADMRSGSNGVVMRARKALSIWLGLVLLGHTSSGGAYGQSVLEYHGSPGRSGIFVVPSLTWERARGMHQDLAFHARFSGHLYAQPLYWQPAGMLIVATEDDTVHAFDAISGNEIWKRILGPPVPLSTQPCGNIDPLGITGTPVIDAATQTIYLDAMVAETSGPHHKIYALSLRDGSPLPGWPVDVADALAARGQFFDSTVQNQRGALLLFAGRVYVPYGGHAGDCGDYHGWVVGVGLRNPQDIVSWSTRGQGGGIWAPGGIATDGRTLLFATGNTIRVSTWSDGEAVFRLAPDLSRDTRSQDFFAPSDWPTLDAQDADLGGTNPLPLDVPFSGGTAALVLALGKDAHAYLLNRNHLGGIGGSLASGIVATGAIITAPAAFTVGEGVFVAFQGQGADCPVPSPGNALTVLQISVGVLPALATVWCGALQGAGSPIITTTDGRSNPIVWILGAEGDDRLHGYRGDTGEPLFAGGGPGDTIPGLRHFQDLLATHDRLYVGADGRLYAFSF